jgi:glutamate racemase
MKYKDYIGVFDSGIGGISVLKELIKVMPNENFIYYGDSINAPYGDKPEEEIVKIVMRIVDYFVENEVKAIVIACNTATSAAANIIREKYKDMIVIGIEPAIKPAFLEHPNEKILTMATQATLKLEKYNKLKEELKADNIIPLPCSGLVERIENNQDVTELLEKYLEPYKGRIKIVVLGCTHYPFIKNEIKKILGDVTFYDGAYKTAVHLKNRLEQQNKLNKDNKKGIVVFKSSSNEEEKYKKFLEKEI